MTPLTFIAAATPTLIPASSPGVGWLLLALLVLVIAALGMSMAAAITTSQVEDSGQKTFLTKASTAFTKHLRVKLDGSSTDSVNLAGAADRHIGTILDNHASSATQVPCSVRLRTHPGTCLMVASAAITAGADVYGAASGKISSTPSGDKIGQAITSATADGDIIEVMPRMGESDQSVGAVAPSVAAAGTTTADAGVLAGGYKVYPTSAADGTKGVRIAAADNYAGNVIVVGNTVAAVLKVYPPAGGTINAGAADAAFSGVSAKGSIFACVTPGTWIGIG